MSKNKCCLILGVAFCFLMQFSSTAFSASNQPKPEGEKPLLAAIPGNLDGYISLSASSFHRTGLAVDESTGLQRQFSLKHAIDIGPSDRLSWVTMFDLSTDRDLSQQGANGMNLSFLTGPQFITSDTGNLRSYIPYFEADWALSDNQTLYQSVGAGIVYSGFLGKGERTEWYVDVDILSRKHKASAIAPLAAEESGPNFHIESEITISGNKNMAVIVKGELERQWAKKEYQSYLDTRATVTIVHSFLSPFKTDSYWRLDISGSIEHLGYDAPDPSIFPDRRDASTELSVFASLNIPVSSNITAFANVTQYWRKSSLPGNNSSATTIETGFNYSF